jgi:hypothetical protein
MRQNEPHNTPGGGAFQAEGPPLCNSEAGTSLVYLNKTVEWQRSGR